GRGLLRGAGPGAGVLRARGDFWRAVVFVAVVGRALVFLAGACLAVAFFAGAFFAVVFFAAVVLAVVAVFLAGAFFAVVFFAAAVLAVVAFFAAVLRAVVVVAAPGAFLAAAFLPAALEVVGGGPDRLPLGAFFTAMSFFGSFFDPLTRSLKPWPARNRGTEVFLTRTRSPVWGLRA